MRKVIFLFFLIPLLFLQTPSPCLLAAEALQMTAQPAFSGRFKFGEWLPIFVTLENSGPDISGEIQVSIPGSGGRLDFAVPAELPAGARKQFTLYTLPNNFSRSARVEFLAGLSGADGSQAGKPLLSREVALTVIPNDRYVIGAVMANPAGLAVINPPQLSGRRERADLLSMSLAELPDRSEGLRLLDALILNDVDTGALTPAQRAALGQWVTRGGRLVLGGGAGVERTLAGLPPELLPVTVAGQAQLESLPGLESFAGQKILVPGPFLATRVQPAADATILANETGLPEDASPNSLAGLPLMVERSFGSGHITFVALDLSQSPFDAWAGVTPFARRLFSPGAAWPDTLPVDVAPQQAADSQMYYALTNLPSLDLPSIRVLGLLLAGYIVLVGPVNYLILRWRDRLAWAWVTIPALTLTFSGLAYWLGFSLRGGDIIVNQVSIIEMGTDSYAGRTQTYTGIFSPRRQTYDIEVTTDTLLRPLSLGTYDPWAGLNSQGGAVRVVESQPARIQGLTIDQWSMQAFVTESVPAEPPGLVAQLRADRAGLSGQIINQSSLTWQDVALVFNDDFQRLGDLAPGQAANVALKFKDEGPVISFNGYMLYQDEYSQATGPDRDTSFKQTVLDNTVFYSSRPELRDSPLLIAWQKDSSPLEIRLEGYQLNTRQTTLLYGPITFKFDDPQVTVPPGFSHLEVLSISGDANECDYSGGASGAYIYQGVVETKLSLPEEVRQVQPDRLELYIRADGTWPDLPVFELYDQNSGVWVPLENARLGPNPISDTARFYNSTDASTQVRISSDGSSGGCYFLELALEGRRL